VRRVLLVAATTGYQTRAFEQAAARLGIELVYATDRCHVIEDPWRDQAIPVRFDDEQASVDRVVARAQQRPFDGVLAVGDRPTVIAALVAQRLGLRFHTPAGAASARNKLLMRERLRQAGLPTPWFIALNAGPSGGDSREVSYPCVVKPLDLSGSRGVIRADDPSSFAAACTRAGSIVISARRESGGATSSQPPSLLVEGFIEGREFAVEGVMTNGVLQALAIFEKPDPLDGPFFEETIYLTPPSVTPSEKRAIVDTVASAAIALELNDGPVHAECRVNQRGVFILEVAARPIGGLCARVLRFVSRKPAETGSLAPLEELLLHHALGETTSGWRREPAAAGVMMIPIRGRGFFRGVSGAEAARAVNQVEDVVVTAKPGQLLVPLPEGSSYLGFIFARAERAADVDCALRTSHACLGFDLAQELRMVESGNG
jgi:biotin carboxylase